MSLADRVDIQITRERAAGLDGNDLPTAAECLRACANTAELAGELTEALRGLCSQATDVCGAIDEFVAMPVKSLSDKFPTSAHRLRSHIEKARALLAKAEKSGPARLAGCPCDSPPEALKPHGTEILVSRCPHHGQHVRPDLWRNS